MHTSFPSDNIRPHNSRSLAMSGLAFAEEISEKAKRLLHGHAE